MDAAPGGTTLVQMLLDGELDAAIIGDQLPDRRLAPLIPSADAAAQEWAKRHGELPINHMMVIRNTISKSRPDLVLNRDLSHAACEPAHGAPV